MEEKRIAYRIARTIAHYFVNANGGITIDGATLCDMYADYLYRKGCDDVMRIEKLTLPLRHWVSAVGYDKDGEFQIVMSDSIQNC